MNSRALKRYIRECLWKQHCRWNLGIKLGCLTLNHVAIILHFHGCKVLDTRVYQQSLLWRQHFFFLAIASVVVSGRYWLDKLLLDQEQLWISVLPLCRGFITKSAFCESYFFVSGMYLSCYHWIRNNYYELQCFVFCRGFSTKLVSCESYAVGSRCRRTPSRRLLRDAVDSECQHPRSRSDGTLELWNYQRI